MADLKAYLNEPDTGAGDPGHQVFEPAPPRMPDAAVLARKHEFGDISIGGLLAFAAAFVVVVAVVFVGVWYFMVVLKGLERSAIDNRTAPVSELTLGDAAAADKGKATVRDLPRDQFPEPRLQPSVYHQKTDEMDMASLRARQEAALISNGWERDAVNGGLKLTPRVIASVSGLLGTPAAAPATKPATAPSVEVPTGETGGAK